MNQNRKLPENVLSALAFFAGLFGFVGVLLVSGYAYLGEGGKHAKACALAALFLAIGFAVLDLFLKFIGMFAAISGEVYLWIGLFEKIVFAVLGFVMLFSKRSDGGGTDDRQHPE